MVKITDLLLVTKMTWLRKIRISAILFKINLIFIDQTLFEDGISVIFDKFSTIKCLSTTKNLVNAELLVVGKLLADGKLLVVSKHLVDSNLFSVHEHVVDTKYI